MEEAADRIKAWNATHTTEKVQAARDPMVKVQQLTMTARWYLSGVAISEIARRNDISVTTVNNDLAEIRREWRKSMVKDYNTLINQQLTRIDHIEERNWQAWEESREEYKRSRTEARRSRLGVVQTYQETTEKRTGDSSYMATIRWCVEERSKILGLYAAVKLDVATKEGESLRDRDTGEARLTAIITRFIESGDVEESDRVIDGTATEVAS